MPIILTLHIQAWGTGVLAFDQEGLGLTKTTVEAKIVLICLY
ncbi:MAG: hypothetical protein OSB16_07385 [Planktomarina sp.]|nr:hypothetical protein [Planktomarina sp.]MDT2058395.1 hypothetical protein [Planktomarina sp.]MDT2073681.1 hypothetical protein [Planktomarina sp.]